MTSNKPMLSAAFFTRQMKHSATGQIRKGKKRYEEEEYETGIVESDKDEVEN